MGTKKKAAEETFGGKRPTKKAIRKRDALAAAPYTMTPAQTVMRHEMEGQGTLPGMGLDDVFDKQQPVSLSEALDQVVGKSQDTRSEFGVFRDEVPSIALEIIDGYDLSLSLAQWRTVQDMIEVGIMRGYSERG